MLAYVLALCGGVGVCLREFRVRLYGERSSVSRAGVRASSWLSRACVRASVAVSSLARVLRIRVTCRQ
jgi:hypothetical protein